MYRRILLGFALTFILAFLPMQNGYSQTFSTDRVIVSQPEVARLDGTKLMQVKQNSQVLLSVSIENRESVPLAYVAIVEVRTKDGVTDYLQFQKGILDSRSSNQIGMSWLPEKSGDFTLRAFLLSDFSSPVILSPVMQSVISVGFLELEDERKTYEEVIDEPESDGQSNLEPVPSDSDASLSNLKKHALKKINEDRKKYNLAAVELSNNVAAQLHAEDVFRTMEISHWMTNGEKPYMTYSRYDGTGDVAQNVATSGDREYHDSCASGKYLCDEIDPYEAVDDAEYGMMYDDEECCDNGHRDNILDKYHTHVSIGIAYDDYYFVVVQNFENQYISWTDEIDDDNPKASTITMAGEFDINNDAYSNNDIKFDGIQIFYDPLPTHEIYEDNFDRLSYDAGEAIAVVVEPLSPGWYYEEPDDYILIESAKWGAYQEGLEVEFSLEDALDEYGDGVYTVTVWCKDTRDDDFVAASISVFLED